MTAAGSHPCLMPSCTRVAHSEWATCGQCYRILPPVHRKAIARAFAIGMTEETATTGLRNALYAARAWVLEAFGAQTKTEYDPGKWERLKSYVRDRDEARARRRASEQATDPPPRPARPTHLKLVP